MIPRRLTFVVFLLLFCAMMTQLSGKRLRYDNYRVYVVQPKSQRHLAILDAMDGKRRSYIFLDAVHDLGAKVHVMVAPQFLREFLRLINSAGIPHLLIEKDAQNQLEENERVADPNRTTNDYSWEEYHELNDTYNWMQSLAKMHAKHAAVVAVGSSFEGREILALKIDYGAEAKRSIFIEAGIHAREWISPATATYIAYQLLVSSDPEVRKVAENYVWYIAPHTNPDGFVYSHTTDRLWRKTRTPYAEDCYGADPNRNWGFHWNEAGANNKSCSETYAGPCAFSEIETRSLAQFVLSMKDNIFLYVSLHSYSQLLMFPYGYTADLAPNFWQLRRISNVAVAAIQRRYGTVYTGGNIYDTLYPAAGTSIDWTYGVAGINNSFTYELRPSRNAAWTGFRLPANQIIPTGEETLDSLVAMVTEASAQRSFTNNRFTTSWNFLREFFLRSVNWLTNILIPINTNVLV